MEVTKEAKNASELIVVAQESGLEKSKVESLLAKFSTSFQAARHIAEEAKDIKVTDESQVEEMQTARQARLELKNIRVEVEHTRKELKEQSLREGKAIDGMANIIKAFVVPLEQKLEEQEKFAERMAEARRQEMVTKRLSVLMTYCENPDMYNYADMEESDFTSLVGKLKQEKLELEAAAKKAEQERIASEKAEREEQERIRKENERLKAEAAAAEAEREKERQAEAKRLAQIEAENKKRLEQERAAAEAERKKREAMEAEQQRLAAEEARKKKEVEEAQRQALLAPDKQKLIAFANVIDALEMPNVSNREAGKLLDETQDFLARISKNLRNKAKEL